MLNLKTEKMYLRSKDAIESSKQHDIEIGNILIAEFMGIDQVDIDTYQETNSNLKYHTSWDWLMPVANEIIKSRDEQNADWDLNDLKYALCTTNIEYVYQAVVEFIKGEGVVDIYAPGYAQYSLYIERCVSDEVEGEILSFKEWKQIGQ